MATNKLTSKFCDNAGVGTHFDGDGLYLLVKPEGKKYWRMVCYLNGKRKLLAFGSYPKISLAKAREERVKAQQLISDGIDPVQQNKQKKMEQIREQQKTAEAAGNTFEQVARRLHANKASKTTDEYRDKILRLLELHLFLLIGHKPINEIQGKELLEIFRNIASKTNHGRPMTYMAKKLCQITGEVFDLASIESNDFINNPCRAIVKHLPNHDTKHMARIRFNQLSKFLETLKKYNGHVLTKAAVWILLYTGMRQASIRRALWEDFDLENAVWNRQPEKSDKEIHIIPLPKQAINLLNEIRPLTGGEPKDLAIPSVRNVHHPMSEAAVCQALARMGYEMVGHGLRGVVSTGLNELGFPPHIVEVQLGHKKESRVEAAYNDAKHFKERCKMMQHWADYLSSL